MPIVSGHLSQKEKIDISNTLLHRAQLVDDYRKYSDFIQHVNAAISESDNLSIRLEEIERMKRAARYMYLVAYTIGSILILVGIAKEKECHYEASNHKVKSKVKKDKGTAVDIV